MATKLYGPLMRGGLDYYHDLVSFLKDYLNAWKNLMLGVNSSYSLITDTDYVKVIKLSTDTYLKFAAFYGANQSTTEITENTDMAYGNVTNVQILLSYGSEFTNAKLIAGSDTDTSNCNFGDVGVNNTYPVSSTYNQIYAIVSTSGDIIFGVNSGAIWADGLQRNRFAYPLFAIIAGKSNILNDEREIIVNWSRLGAGFGDPSATNRFPYLSSVSSSNISGYVPAGIYAPDKVIGLANIDTPSINGITLSGSSFYNFVGTVGVEPTSAQGDQPQFTKLDPAWSPNSTYISKYSKFISFTPYRFDGAFLFNNHLYYAFHGLALLDDPTDTTIQS